MTRLGLVVGFGPVAQRVAEPGAEFLDLLVQLNAIASRTSAK
jgi:hypothetical protein